MAEYKGIKGFKVQSLASDPSGPEGQVWYNTATNLLKYQAAPGSWASGGAMNQSRYQFASTGATQDTALAIAGAPPATLMKNVEEYDGSAWTEKADVLVGRMSANAAGTNTAALFIGGANGDLYTSVESFNGTSWTEGNNLVVKRSNQAAVGTQTAALCISGTTPPVVTSVESWNGTSWTEGNNVNTGRGMGLGFGTQAGAIFASGEAPPAVDNVESWNGTSWTNTTVVNTKHVGGASGGATSTNGMVFGGKHLLLLLAQQLIQKPGMERLGLKLII